ncbi:hypothetical protein MTO96_022176 [Rhipicephalus appendiculatus]
MPNPADEPMAPSTTRITLGTLLVIAVVTAVTLTLGWLDWPFAPGDSHGDKGLSSNSSADAHRRGEVVRGAAADNDTIDGGLEPVSAANVRKVARSTIVEGVRTLDDELDDTSPLFGRRW